MSTKFFHKLDKTMGGYDRTTFTRKDFKDVQPYLETFLTNLKTRSELEDFLHDYPEVRKKLNNEEEYRHFLHVACSKDTPLIHYLMEHTPGGRDFYELHADDHYGIISTAATAGRKDVVELLVKNAPPGVMKAFVKKHAYPIGEFYDHNLNNAIPTLLRCMPREDACALIKHEDSARHYSHPALKKLGYYLLLHEMLKVGHFDEFQEFFSYLPKADQHECLSSQEIQIAIQMYSSEVLDNLMRIAGDDAMREAFNQVPVERMPITVGGYNPETQSYHSVTHDAVPHAYTRIHNSHDTHCPEVILGLYEQGQADEILSLFDYSIFARTLENGETERFRMLSEKLSPASLARMHESPFVKAKYHALKDPRNTEILEEIADIIPASCVAEARKNRIGYVPPPPRPPAAPKPKKASDYSLEEKTALLKAHPEFKPDLYEQILPYMKIAAEAEHGIYVEHDAAKLAVLFSKMKEVDRYFSNTLKGYGGRTVKQPVHDACLFTIPEEPFDAKHWRDMVLKYGPAASRYLGIAHRIEKHAQKHHLPLPETPAQLADLAQYVVYERAMERLPFARACIAKGVSEEQFDRCLDVLQGKATVRVSNAGELDIVVKNSSNIPDVTIDGEEIGHPSYYMRKLNVSGQIEQKMLKQMQGSTDPLTDTEIATILGELSHCCQSIGKWGEKFTLHGLTSEDGDFYIWMKKLRDQPDLLVAQSWVWKAADEHNPHTLVFDSIEPLGNAHNYILKDFMEAFAKRVKPLGIEQVNIGMGGKTPRDLPFAEATQPGRLRKFDFATTGAEHDSKRQWVVGTRASKAAPDLGER